MTDCRNAERWQLKTIRTFVAGLMATVLAWGTAQASPASLGWTGIKKGATALAEKCGIKAVGKEALVRGGTEFAAAKSMREMAKRTTELRPGQILAVGGAGAMVVAAHEISDGAQTTFEAKAETIKAAGEAIKADPDAAVRVINGSSVMVGKIMVAVVALTLGVLLWLFFPLITAMRARVKETTRRNTVRAAGFTLVQTLFALAGFLVLTLLGIKGCLSQSATTVSSVSGNGTRNVAQYKSLTDAYHAALNRHYQAFLNDVSSTVENAYTPVTAVIPAVKRRYGGLGKLAHLAKTMVVDKLSDRNEVRQEIEADLKSCYYPAIYAAHDASLRTCAQLNDALAKERAQYVRNVKALDIQLPANLESSFESTLENSAVAIDAAQEKLSAAQTTAVIAGVIETVCIRSTIKTIAKAMAKTVARQTATMTASVGLACADGPLPVGDIVGAAATVGCTVWSCVDIYKATKIVPEEFEATLVRSTRDCRNATENTVRDCAATIFAAYSGER